MIVVRGSKRVISGLVSAGSFVSDEQAAKQDIADSIISMIKILIFLMSYTP